MKKGVHEFKTGFFSPSLIQEMPFKPKIARFFFVVSPKQMSFNLLHFQVVYGSYLMMLLLLLMILSFVNSGYNFEAVIYDCLRTLKKLHQLWPMSIQFFLLFKRKKSQISCTKK